MAPGTSRRRTFQVIPSIDLLGGNVVRLLRGDFDQVTVYGDPLTVIDDLGLEHGSRLHVVDLDASRRGKPVETKIVAALAARGFDLQVGGGVRSLADVRTWLDCGAARVVVGTVTAASPRLLEALVTRFSAARIVPAIDVRGRTIRTAGWKESSERSIANVFEDVDALGLSEVLVTDIERDGVMGGPSFALYRELGALTRARIIASGGVSTTADVVSLARLPNTGGCVIGRALLERKLDLGVTLARASAVDSIPERIIPCLDVRDGRVVKGVQFENVRDAGDPVECARRYEAEGADELVILDISATDSDRGTSLDTVRAVAEALFIPLTVGGGVRSVEDFRALLRAGADRVAINTAALRNPQLIFDCAREFGVQAVVLSCDAKREGERWVATMRSGRETTDVDAVEWCTRAAALGAGEILLTSVDRDGTSSGFDIALLRAVSSAVRIGVIASGGAGRIDHFREAIESGGARAVLAASLFHDRVLSVREVKQYLEQEGIPVRW